MNTPIVTLPPEFLETSSPEILDLYAGTIETHASLLRLVAIQKRREAAIEEFTTGLQEIVSRRARPAADSSPADAAPSAQG